MGDAYRWVLSNGDFQAWCDPSSTTTRLLWINGRPGTGKTMLLCGILDELRNSKASHRGNIAFFFCEKSNERANNAEAVLRGLLFMLATGPQRRSVIRHIRDKYDNSGAGIFQGPSAWWSLRDMLNKALSKMDRGGEKGDGDDAGGGVTYLAVDALDECEHGLERLLALIADSSSPSSTTTNAETGNPRVRWLVTSRGEDDIRKGLRVSRAGLGLSLNLDYDYAEEIDKAVDMYIHHCSAKLAKAKNKDEEYEVYYSKINEGLHKNKGEGTFLHVTLLARELGAVERGKRLEELQGMAVDVRGLYRQAEARIRNLDDDDDDEGEGEGEGGRMRESCLRALSAVAVAYRPLRDQELCALAGLGDPEEERARRVIHLCGSFFAMGDHKANFIHESAREYLQLGSRTFEAGLRTEHYRLFSSCLDVMQTRLRRDMYGLGRPDIRAAEGRREGAENNSVISAAEYARDYWIDHLIASGDQQHNDDDYYHVHRDTRGNRALSVFLKTQFLCWLEYLSLGGNMREALSLWTKLVGFLKVGKYVMCPTLGENSLKRTHEVKKRKRKEVFLNKVRS